MNFQDVYSNVFDGLFRTIILEVIVNLEANKFQGWLGFKYVFSWYIQVIYKSDYVFVFKWYIDIFGSFFYFVFNDVLYVIGCGLVKKVQNECLGFLEKYRVREEVNQVVGF